MSNQITGTTTRNYDPSEMLGLKHQTNDMGPYFLNAVTSAPGLEMSGGPGSAYPIGLAYRDAILAGTTLTVTAAGLVLPTGNSRETTGTGTGFPPTYTTGSDLGTTGLTATLAEVAALRTTMIALTGTDLTSNASAIEAWNDGHGLGVFVPGVYTTASAIGMTAAKTITLSGAGDYVFISTGGAITFGATDVIVLTNGATAGRVWWVADAAITTGATDTLFGNFLSTAATITIGATNVIYGRLLSPAAITIAGTASVIGLPNAGSGAVIGANANTFGVRTQDTLGVSVTPGNMPTLVGALRPDGVSVAGDLAFNDGTVPAGTLACRMYTFLAKVNTVTGAVTLSVVAGNDFIKGRPVNVTTDVNLGDGTRAIVGYLYVKNESSAVFVPGTTFLNATGLTTKFGDGYGYMSYNAVA